MDSAVLSVDGQNIHHAVVLATSYHNIIRMLHVAAHNHSGIATSIRLQKHTDILTVYKEYGMIMEEPLVNETDIS